MLRNLLLTLILLFSFLATLRLQADTDMNYEYETSLSILVKSMPLDKLCGQMIMVSGYSNLGDNHFSMLKKWTKKGQIGGLIWMQGSPNRQSNMIRELQDISQKNNGLNLLMAQDAEWGAAMRLDSLDRLPWPLTLSATRNNKLAYEYGKSLGAESIYLGINVNFSPVVDLNTNPRNPIIGQRSLGSDLFNVNNLSKQQIWGIQSQGVMACAKHFPGHGDTETDSHKTLPTLSHDLQTLISREMAPFINAIHSGVGAIMVAHLNIPALDSTGTPASLSRPIVTHWLRDSLNFKGLIFTDALNMKGISQDLPPGEIEVRAIEAGNDVLLFVSDPKSAIDAIVNAVKNGRLSREEIEGHVMRILESKSKYLLSDQDKINNEDLLRIKKARKKLSNEIYASANTLVYDNSGLLDSNSNSKVYFKSYYKNLNNLSDSKNIFSDHEIHSHEIDGNGTIWFLNIEKTTSPWKNGNISINLLKDAEEFKAKGFKIGLIQMANPYGLIRSSNSLDYAKKLTKIFDAVIIGYEGENNALGIMKRVVLRGIKKGFPGFIPVSGINLNPEKSTHTFASIGLNSNVIELIDSIVNEGINEDAFPGCQIFLSRYGRVVLDSAWGTLDGFTEAKTHHLYDVASLTKILTSMPLLMQYYERYGGEDFLDSPISKLLPEFTDSSIDSLVVKEILAHQSGLPGWIPFYQKFIWSDGSLDNQYFRSIKTPEFNISIAPKIYGSNIIRDSIFKSISSVELGDLNYKYSDLGYYLFQRFIEQQQKLGLDKIAHSQWYKPMGLSMTFNPLVNGYESFDIAPTENDLVFRKQQIRATVHDQGAALLGGVAGHAGLFSNAYSVGQIMQLYLNGGNFNGYKYLNPQTLKRFVTCYSCETGNRRGLGFDRPQKEGDGPTCGCVSENSFGHTGFTGTFAWADPESGIILVFLSNRIFPNAENKKIYELDIRTRIQQVIQDSIL